MSQIVIAGLVFVAALAATLHHRQAARIAATELSRLRTEQTDANSTLASFQTRTAASAKRHAELSIDLSAASAELKATSEAALHSRIEPNPATEGAWPADKPYFYLPKRLLSDIGFTALGADGEPTLEAIALLGLTPSERDDLRHAWADFRFDLQELQLQSAERMPDTNAVPDPNRRSIRFKLSSLANQLPRLREQLDVASLKPSGPRVPRSCVHRWRNARGPDLTHWRTRLHRWISRRARRRWRGPALPPLRSRRWQQHAPVRSRLHENHHRRSACRRQRTVSSRCW